MRKILFFVCAMLTWLHTDVTAKTLVFSITAAAQENQTMIVRLAEIEVYPQYLKEYLEFANEVDRLSVEREPVHKDSHSRNLCLRGSLSAAPEDRPLPEIQAGHAPHGERPETAYNETPRPRDNESDIQKAEIIWTT